MSERKPPEIPARGSDPLFPVEEALPEPPSETTAEVAKRRGFRLRGRSLRQHVARGALINSVFMIGFNLLGLFKGFLLAVFLTRADYGVWGIVATTITTLLFLKQAGIGDKYIQQDEEDQEVAFQRAFTLELFLTLAIMALIAALLPLVAVVYDEPQIVAPGLVMLAILPATVLQAPLWSYYRRMEFLKQRLLQGIDPVVGFVVAIGLAAAGAGYWSIVIGLVAGVWSTALAALITSPYKLRLRFDRKGARSYLNFSWPLMVANLATLFLAQGAILATDTILGLAAAGAVTLAAVISQFTDRVDALITSALYPAICAVRDRVDLLAESFVKSNRLALTLAMPFGIGLSLFAGDLVHFLIGDEWETAIVLLHVFGLTAAFGHIAFNWSAYFRAVGNTKPMAVASVAAAVSFLATAIPLLHSNGLAGVAIATAVQTAVHVACRVFFLRRLFGAFAFFRHAFRAMAPAVLSALAILGLRVLESGERTGALAAGELALFLGLVAALTLALERPLLREAAGYMLQRPAAGAAA